MSALAPGVELCDGRYRLERPLGSGGMAVVWLARDLQLDRDVAVKVISDALAMDERFLARFEREARVAAGLSHPNLVKVFDYSAEAERPFLVLEFIDGPSLADVLRDERRARPDALALARDLLGVLDHIHEAGIVHRDVKPANVLLGRDGRTRLTDFGIAQLDESGGLTATGQVLGTARYIAPEVLSGEPASARSDLYALGVLLRECEAPELAPLVERLTAEDPAARPASAAAALRGLEPSEETQPLTQRLPAAEPERVIHVHLDRARLRLLGVLAGALVLIALVVVLASGGDGERPPLRPAPAEAPLSEHLDGLERMVDQAARP